MLSYHSHTPRVGAAIIYAQPGWERSLPLPQGVRSSAAARHSAAVTDPLIPGNPAVKNDDIMVACWVHVHVDQMVCDQITSEYSKVITYPKR